MEKNTGLTELRRDLAAKQQVMARLVVRLGKGDPPSGIIDLAWLWQAKVEAAAYALLLAQEKMLPFAAWEKLRIGVNTEEDAAWGRLEKLCGGYESETDYWRGMDEMSAARVDAIITEEAEFATYVSDREDDRDGQDKYPEPRNGVVTRAARLLAQAEREITNQDKKDEPGAGLVIVETPDDPPAPRRDVFLGFSSNTATPY